MLSTAPSRPVPLASAARSQLREMAQRGLRSAVAGLVIGLMLTSVRGQLVPTLVHSVFISIGCWFAIDLLRMPLARWAHRQDPPDVSDARGHWPGWPLMLVAIVVGSLLGFGVGGTLAGLVLGRGIDLAAVGRGDWRIVVPTVAMALVPGLAITYWFYLRETVAAQESAVQAAERRAAEHQLKLLESQLEPHMLFNTLANLRVLIGLDPPRAQALLDQLIAFLRATLAGSRASHHPLSAEFARLADYLALMQVRMDERLRPVFDLPAGLAALPVPPLLLQPLVENAIKHGLEPAIGGGRIEVSASCDGEILVLRVRDTGVGLSAAAAAESDGTHFGLTQVRERLHTQYGAVASLTLAPADDADGGTRATIRMPLPAAPPALPIP